MAFIDRHENSRPVPGNTGIGVMCGDCWEVDQVRGEGMRVQGVPWIPQGGFTLLTWKHQREPHVLHLQCVTCKDSKSSTFVSMYLKSILGFAKQTAMVIHAKHDRIKYTCYVIIFITSPGVQVKPSWWIKKGNTLGWKQSTRHAIRWPVDIHSCNHGYLRNHPIWGWYTHSVLNRRLMEFIQGGKGNMESRLISFSLSSVWK